MAKQRVSILSTRKQKEVTLSSSDAPYESQDGSGSRVLSPAVSKVSVCKPNEKCIETKRLTYLDFRHKKVSQKQRKN